MLWKIYQSGKTRYNDVTYAAHLKLLEIRFFHEHIFKAYNKLHKSPHYWPFLTGSTGDRHVTRHWWGNVSLSSPYHALSSTASWYLWRKYLQYIAYGKSRDPCPYVLRKLRLKFKPRSHQTRSQYVLQNEAERGQTVRGRNERCDNCLEYFYEVNGHFMDGVDGLEREGHTRTLSLLKILRRPSRSEIGRSDNVLKTRWTFYERNCRTSDLLGTHYNAVQSSISY